MVGSVGMVRGGSHPGSLVIQEALNLLSALGSDSKGTTTKLLTEMKGIQDHNEVVLADAQAAVVGANKREDEVVEREAKLARDLREAEELYSNRLLAITNGEEKLQREVENANNQISEENKAISSREDKFNREKEEHVVAHSKGLEFLVERERILKEDREVLEGNIELLKQHQSSLEDSQQRIDSDRLILDALKLKLDNRDARVLAAMEGKAIVEGD